MARGNFMQTSFLGGEWSPFSQGKSDQKDYYTAVNLALNMLPTDEGALIRRSGTRFSAHAKTSDGVCRLIPFISESADALVCELTSGLMRFHSRGTLLTEDRLVVSGVTAATPGVVTTVGSHGYLAGETVVFLSPDQPFPMPVRNKQFIVSSPSGATFNINNTEPVGVGSADGTELNAILQENLLEVGKVIERTIPYDSTELPAIKYTEEEDTLYLFHKDHEIRTVARTNLPVAQFDLLDGPYLPQNETATTLGFSGTSGSGITVTASAATGINGGLGFQSTDVGRVIRVNTGDEVVPSWSWLRITAHTSATVVTATILGDMLEATTAVATWRLGLYSDTTGWPTHGVIHEGRLFLISNVQNGRVDGSRSPGVVGARFNDFSPTAADGTVADDNAISAIFSGAGRQNARWLQSVSDGLLVGTDGGEYVVRASSFDDPLSPFSIQVRRHTTFGSADILPARAGRQSLFIQELGRSVFEYRSIGGGQYDGNDVSRGGKHLMTDGITQIAYQKVPNPVLWCLRGDKRIVGCTYRDDLEGRQVAWHRHSIEYAADEAVGEDGEGRYLRAGRSQSEATCEDIVVAPFSDLEATRNDNLWMAVDRGGTRSIEYMQPIFDISKSQNEGFFVDSGNIYYHGDLGVNWEVLSSVGGNSTLRFYGLNRLAGKTVDGMFRGFDMGTAVVASAGYADFTISDELLTAPAAVENQPSTFLTAGNLTFSSGFVSTYREATPLTIGYAAANSTIITGEDGIDYFVSGGGNAGAGAVGNNVIIRKASDGTVAFTKTGADIYSDGAIPPGGNVGDPAISSTAAFAVADTPYIIAIKGGAVSTDVGKKVVYYKINSSSALEVVGSYVDKTDGLSTQFSPPQAGGHSIRSVGHVMARPVGDGPIAFRYPLAVTWFGEGRATMHLLRSINDVILTGNLGWADTDPWKTYRETDISVSSLFGANIFEMTDHGGGSDNIQDGFYLPRASGLGSYYCMMFFTKDLEKHSAGTEAVTGAWLDVNAAGNETGLISSLHVNMRATLDEDDPYPWLQSITTPVVSRNSFFDVFPFPDDKEDFSGTPGDALDNYYSNPTVLPFDPDDETKPWLLFFPRLYREVGDREKLGVRIYQWDPVAEKASFLSFAKGQCYELTTDVDSDTNPSGFNVRWNRQTGNLRLLVRGQMSGEGNWIVADFGTFLPTLGASGEIVTPRYIDAVVGCNFRSRGQTLRPDAGAGAQNGPGLGKLRRIDQYALLTFKTGETYIGTDFDTMFRVAWENPAGQDAFGRDPLFSAVAHGALESRYDFDNPISWEIRRPYPGAYVSLAGFSNMSDR